jgi:Phage integrase family
VAGDPLIRRSFPAGPPSACAQMGGLPWADGVGMNKASTSATRQPQHAAASILEPEVLPKAVGMPELHFHDLRHTGNTMAAAQGASLRELMERMGHSSTRAALIYLHATRERDHAIAAGMGKVFKAAKKTTRSSPSGTQRARRRERAS